jgi:hypothetical protein
MMEFCNEQTILFSLLNGSYKTTTYNGAKSKFSEHFIKTEKLSLDFGRKYPQLFSWKQKGDYADLFDFTEEEVFIHCRNPDTSIHICLAISGTTQYRRDCRFLTKRRPERPPETPKW